MPGELEKYLQDFQSYVTKIGTGVKPTPPPKPTLTETETVLVIVMEKVLASVPIKAAPIFEVEAFHNGIMADTQATYGVVNDATIAFKATDRGVVTPCLSYQQAQGYWAYLAALYEKRFVWIWGYGFDDAVEKVKEDGCPTCGDKGKCTGWSTLEGKALYLDPGGLKYYTALLDLRRIWGILANVEELPKKVSWAMVIQKLGKPTLYSVGSLAGIMLGK